ncbi:MAG: hypothetical protein AB7D07_00290 [Desulfovibrionaceae bacterium]
MAGFLLPPTSPDNVPVPEAGKVYVFINSNDGSLYLKDSSGAATSLRGADGLLAAATLAQTNALTRDDVAVTPASLAGLLRVERREIPAAAFSPDATNGAEPLPGGLVIAATGATVDVYAFDSAVRETITYPFRLPDTWNGGPVTAQITCLPGDASASEGDRMEWEIVLNAQGHGDAWVSSGVSQVVSVAVPSTIQGAPIDTVVTPDITIGGDPQPGDWAVMQISRNADSTNDTMAFDAWLLSCVLNITHGVEEA